MTPLELAFDRYGDDGLPLIILHGLFGARRNWNAIGRKLSTCYSVYLLDLRNHGASPHSTSMDIPHLAADLQYFLDQHGIDKALFLGHSLGGKAAMWLALTKPESVIGFIAVDIAPVSYAHNFDEIYDALRSLDLASLVSRQDADEKLSRSISHPGLRQFLLQNLTVGQKGYVWRLDLDILQTATPDLLSFPATDNIEPYAGPAFLLRAENSKYVLPEHGQEIKQLFPCADVVLLENSGHWVNVDQPDRVLELIRSFGQRLG